MKADELSQKDLVKEFKLHFKNLLEKRTNPETSKPVSKKEIAEFILKHRSITNASKHQQFSLWMNRGFMTMPVNSLILLLEFLNTTLEDLIPKKFRVLANK